MKKIYKKLLIYELFIIIILIINSYTFNILNNYNRLLFIIFLIIIFKTYFGIEKLKKRYEKDVILETIIYLIIFFILYYLLGIYITYAKVNNYYTLTSIKNILLPIIIYIILKEYLRYIIIIKTENNINTKITTIIMFILLDITNTLYYYSFTNSYKVLIFLGITLLPSITNNIIFSCIYRSKTNYILFNYNKSIHVFITYNTKSK